MVLFSLAVYFFLLLAKRVMFDEQEAYFAAIIFAAVPRFFISGTLLLPDAALILFWVMGLYFFRKTLDSPIILNWFMFGIAAGFGMLSKYTIALLGGATLLFLLVDPPSRRWYRTSRPCFAVLLSLLVFSPVIIWCSSSCPSS